MALEKDDLEFYLTPMNEKLDDIKNHLATLNSKTQRNTIDIAVIQALATEAKTTASSTARNHGAFWGTVGSVGIMIASLIYQWVFGAPPPTVK